MLPSASWQCRAGRNQPRRTTVQYKGLQTHLPPGRAHPTLFRRHRWCSALAAPTPPAGRGFTSGYALLHSAVVAFVTRGARFFRFAWREIPTRFLPARYTRRMRPTLLHWAAKAREAGFAVGIMHQTVLLLLSKCSTRRARWASIPIHAWRRAAARICSGEYARQMRSTTGVLPATIFLYRKRF